MTSRQLGVDVSKAKLDVALLQVNGKFKSKVFENTVQGIEALRRGGLGVRPLQEWSAAMHRELAGERP